MQVSRVVSDMISAPLAPSYNVYDLYDDARLLQKLAPSDELRLMVNPAGGVRMVKLEPQATLLPLPRGMDEPPVAFDNRN